MSNPYSIPFGDPGIAPGGDSTRGGALPPGGGAGGASESGSGGSVGQWWNPFNPAYWNLSPTVPFQQGVRIGQGASDAAIGGLGQELSVIWDDLSRAAPEAGVYLLLAVMLIVGVASLLSGAK